MDSYTELNLPCYKKTMENVDYVFYASGIVTCSRNPYRLKKQKRIGAEFSFLWTDKGSPDSVTL
jgi:hypothetical protein